MRKYLHTKPYFVLLTIILLVGCQKQPQKVRILNENPVLDSAMMSQLQMNIHLADAADRDCKEFVETDSITYAMDDLGFWYAKTITGNTDTVQLGQELLLHLQISEIGGNLISDSKHHHIMGSGELPMAINRSLKMMCIGDQMQIVAPWYTAYGVEGTSLIKPYSNLFIIITLEK